MHCLLLVLLIPYCTSNHSKSSHMTPSELPEVWHVGIVFVVLVSEN